MEKIQVFSTGVKPAGQPLDGLRLNNWFSCCWIKAHSKNNRSSFLRLAVYYCRLWFLSWLFVLCVILHFTVLWHDTDTVWFTANTKLLIIVTWSDPFLIPPFFQNIRPTSSQCVIHFQCVRLTLLLTARWPLTVYFSSHNLRENWSTSNKLCARYPLESLDFPRKLLMHQTFLCQLAVIEIHIFTEALWIFGFNSAVTFRH